MQHGTHDMSMSVECVYGDMIVSFNDIVVVHWRCKCKVRAPEAHGIERGCVSTALVDMRLCMVDVGGHPYDAQPHL